MGYARILNRSMRAFSRCTMSSSRAWPTKRSFRWRQRRMSTCWSSRMSACSRRLTSGDRTFSLWRWFSPAKRSISLCRPCSSSPSRIFDRTSCSKWRVIVTSWAQWLQSTILQRHRNNKLRTGLQPNWNLRSATTLLSQLWARPRRN